MAAQGLVQRVRPGIAHQQREPVRRGSRHHLRSKGAIGARKVPDHDRLTILDRAANTCSIYVALPSIRHRIVKHAREPSGDVA